MGGGSFIFRVLVGGGSYFFRVLIFGGYLFSINNLRQITFFFIYLN